MVHRRLLQLAGAAPGVILGLAAFGMLVSALHVGFAFALARVVAALIRGESVPAGAFALLLGLIAVRALVLWAREVTAAHAGARVRIALRRRLLNALASVPGHERDSGSAATTVIDGVEGLDPYFTKYLPQLIVTLSVPPAVTAAVWMQSPWAGAVLAAAVLGAVVVPRFWDARLLANGRSRWEAFESLQSRYVEALQNIPLLRAFGATERTAEEFAECADDLRDHTMR